MGSLGVVQAHGWLLILALALVAALVAAATAWRLRRFLARPQTAELVDRTELAALRVDAERFRAMTRGAAVGGQWEWTPPAPFAGRRRGVEFTVEFLCDAHPTTIEAVLTDVTDAQRRAAVR